MSDIPNSTISTHNKYLNQDRSVNIQQHLQQQQKLQNNKLGGLQVREKGQQLGKNDFLKLLVTQLTHQDPTQPVKDQQFIAQMAQFSSLEQMQNMASSFNRLADRQAHELIGRYVSGLDFVSGEPVDGIVKALFYDKSGNPFVKVKGRSIALTQIQMIGDASLAEKKEVPVLKQSETIQQDLREVKTPKAFENNQNIIQKADRSNK